MKEQYKNDRRKYVAVGMAAATTVGAFVLPHTRSVSAATAVALDHEVTANAGASSATVTSPALTTSGANELLLAFVALDGPNAPTSQSVSSVSGGGLSWSRVSQSNAQAGTAEVWAAYASTQLSNVRVSAKPAASGYPGSITVAAFTGALSVVGATGANSASSGAPNVDLTTSATGSWTWAVGNDWDNGIARTPAAGQTLDSQNVDTQVGNTFWVQHINAQSTAAGQAQTVADTAPTSDRFDFAAAEIVPATSVSTTTSGSSSTAAPAATTTIDTLWPSSAVPAQASANDPNSVEIGTRFQVTQSGSITGIRFYKGSGNSGTHVGHLWSNSGSLLASGTFTNETATGWQDMRFATPVSVAAGTTLVASYFAPSGHYADTVGYFNGKSVTSTGLTAPADGTNGLGNGVYRYGTTSGFPASTYYSTNYWVDVDLAPSSGSTATTSTTVATGSGTTSTTVAPTTSTTAAPTTTTTAPSAGSTTGEFTTYYQKWANGPDPSGNPSYYPVGVWMPNLSNGPQYQALGVNTAVQGQGTNTYNWTNFDGPSGSGQFATQSPFSPTQAASNVSNYVADEPDMNQVNYGTNNPLTAPVFSSSVASLKTTDPSRPAYANFGKCFSEPGWVGCQTGIQQPAASSVASMVAQYAQNVDILSSDYYGYTDPYDALNNGVQKYYGAWTYGAAVANVHAIAGSSKPAMVFVETGSPWSSSSNTITPAQIQAAVWDGVLHGANGVIYFDHDFSGVQSDNGMVNGGPQSGAVATMVKGIDSELAALAPWLNAPSQSGVTVSSTNGIPVTTMLKTYGGHTYLFAMADGNSSHLNSGSTAATITVPGTFGSSAAVYGESRSVGVSGGNSISDSFAPYQVHVYQLS